MSDIENTITLKGRLVVPDAIHGKSAYEIAVMHGFDGTEEEWLDSLKADFDERADDAKASIDDEVDNVIVPEAIAEIIATTEGEKQKVTDAGDEAVDVIVSERLTSISDFEDAAREQTEILAAAAKTIDPKEELLWENPDTTDTYGFWEQTIEVEVNEYEYFKILAVASTGDPAILPSVALRPEEKGRIFSINLSGVDNVYRDVEVSDTGIHFHNAAFDYNSEVVPYRIYGVKQSVINLPGTFGDFVTDTPGISNNKVMSQRAACGSFMGALKQTVEGKDVTIDDIAEAPHGVEVLFHSKNMFNKATTSDKRGLILNPSGNYELGDLGTSGSDNKFVSDFIKVEEGKTYHINYIYDGSVDHRYYAVGYDADKKGVVCLFNKYANSSPYDDSENCNFTVPLGMGIKYVRFQGLLEDKDDLQMELGTVFTEKAEFVESVVVTATDGDGKIIDSKAVPTDEVVAFESVYPVMRLYTLEAAVLKVRYNVEINSAFANEGEEWGE